MEALLQDIYWTLPLFILVTAAIIVMLLDALGIEEMLPILSGLSLIAASVTSIPGIVIPKDVITTFYGHLHTGGIYGLFYLFISATAFLLLFYIEDFLQRTYHKVSDVYALILLAAVGMQVLVGANSLMLIFIGIETFSIAFYIITGLYKTTLESNEAALKYFILGAFASSFLAMGMALLYGASGTMLLSELQKLYAVLFTSEYKTLYLGGMALLLVGFLFKIAAFPFHAWSPDTYTGSPTAFIGFLAGSGKLATFLALCTLFAKAVPEGAVVIKQALVVIAVLTMIYGNYVAVRQQNIKRILAYSSIAHSGYVLLGVVSGLYGYSAVALYMIVYTLMTLGAFGLVALLQEKDQEPTLETWRGLGLQRPWIGTLLAIFLFSLAGIPPLAGFIAKYYLFAAAIKAGYMIPAVIGVLTSVIGAYYYLRILVVLFLYKPYEKSSWNQKSALGAVFASVIIAVLLLLLGIFPHYLQYYLDQFSVVAFRMNGIL